MIKFRGDQQKVSGFLEIRGIVNKDQSLSYGEYTQYDNEFGKYQSPNNNGVKYILINFAI